MSQTQNSQTDQAPKKAKEKTIRGETTKAFLYIFAILAVVGTFTIFSSFKGARTFDSIRQVHLQQFKAAEIMKQQALDIIGIYYLLGGNQDMEIQMVQLKRYDGLVADFDKAALKFKEIIKNNEQTEGSKNILTLMDENKSLFDAMNNNCRLMTFAQMEGKVEETKKYFGLVNKDISDFKAQIDKIETIVNTQLEAEADNAQSLLKKTTWIGIVLTILAIFVSLGLIYLLMQFLSVSLLPISNLMHNMRQAVFSIAADSKVVSPVSKYSHTVFNQDIVGKSVYDVVYPDLDPGGEVMAQARMGFVSTFGEDELQWMLTADCLPKQVERKFENPVTKEIDERILKLTYTPLWDKEEKLQNIMIVAEDVTEVEKLRQEALKKQGEITIIHGVVNVNREDLEGFLVDSQNKLIEARAQVPLISKSAESRQLLFRILHTLKGNSRLYNLNVLSEVIHHVENDIVAINKSFDENEPFKEELLQSFVRGLDEIEESYANHSKVAKKLFGINDLYGGKKEELLHRSICAIEVSMDESMPKNLNPGVGASKFRFPKMEEFVEKVDSSFSNAIESAKYFENQDLVTSLYNLKEMAQTGTDGWKSAFYKMGEEYCLASLRCGFVKEYSTEHQKWISIFHKIIEMTSSYESLSASNNLNPKVLESFQSDIDWVFNLADAENFYFLRLQAVKMGALVSLNSDNKELVSGLRPIMNSLWRYMATVCSVDMSSSLDPQQWKTFQKGILEIPQKMDEASRSLNELPSNKLLLVSFLRSLVRKSITPTKFWEQSLKYFELQDKSMMASYYMGSSDEKESLENFFETLKMSSEDQMPLGQSLGSTSYKAFNDFLKSIPLGGPLRMDLIHFLAAHLKLQSGGGLNGEAQTIEIPVRSFNEIKSEILGLDLDALGKNSDSLFDTLRKLQLSVQHALDVPVKSVCHKMDSMIKDLSKRLEKEIQFKVYGDEIYVGREDSYQLRDALVHLLRNSLDHGIEGRQERQQAGKPEKATISIGCRKLNDHIELVIHDDGRGINTAKVLNKAVSMGLLNEEKANLMSDEEKLQLIFMPNLSTKEEITNLSGRGVGMDAVKKTLEKMGGSIVVQSKTGVGTEFKLQIYDGVKVKEVKPISTSHNIEGSRVA